LLTFRNLRIVAQQPSRVNYWDQSSGRDKTRGCLGSSCTRCLWSTTPGSRTARRQLQAAARCSIHIAGHRNTPGQRSTAGQRNAAMMMLFIVISSCSARSCHNRNAISNRCRGQYRRQRSLQSLLFLDRAMEPLPLASNTFRLLLFFTSGIPTYVHRASKLARSAAKKRRRTEFSASSIGSSGVHR